MILLIDNYDSFTYNLFHLVGSLGARLAVRRNDAITVDQALATAPQGIILSPGPCDPDRAGICLPLVRAAAGRVPLLGVCLGHQAIGQAFGGRIVRAPKPMHGKMSRISHGGEGLFRGLPSPFTATRYHSLIVERSSLPAELAITAESEDGLIMGLAHRQHPVFGVQFHPESIASEQGAALLANFLSVAESFRPQLKASA
jgi:anthranilate synthase component 2